MPANHLCQVKCCVIIKQSAKTGIIFLHDGHKSYQSAHLHCLFRISDEYSQNSVRYGTHLSF